MNGTSVPLEIRGKTLVATENGEEMVILSVADRTEIHWAGQVMELRRVQSSGPFYFGCVLISEKWSKNARQRLRKRIGTNLRLR